MTKVPEKSGAELSAPVADDDEANEPRARIHGILTHSSQILRYVVVSSRYGNSREHLEMLAIAADRRNAEIPTDDLMHHASAVEIYPGESVNEAQHRIEAATLILADRGIDFKPRKN